CPRLVGGAGPARSVGDPVRRAVHPRPRLPRRGVSRPLFDRPRAELSPGAVHLPGWLDLAGQRRLVAAFREWAAGPVPARAAVLPGGHAMSVRTVCLGWHWRPYRYTRTADDVNGARVLDLRAGWPSSGAGCSRTRTAR